MSKRHTDYYKLKKSPLLSQQRRLYYYFTQFAYEYYQNIFNTTVLSN